MFIASFLRPFALLSVLAAAAVTDAAFHKVYNNQILLGFGTQILIDLFQRPETDPIQLSYAVGFLMLLFLFYGRHMIGGADIKLYALVVFAFPNRCSVMIIVLSVISGAVCSVLLLCGARRKQRHRITIPMGLFVFAGACLTLLT